jgi:hypothetical protein
MLCAVVSAVLSGTLQARPRGRPYALRTAHTTASVTGASQLRNADKCLSILRSRVDCAEFLPKEGLRECPIENRICLSFIVFVFS